MVSGISGSTKALIVGLVAGAATITGGAFGHDWTAVGVGSGLAGVSLLGLLCKVDSYLARKETEERNTQPARLPGGTPIEGATWGMAAT